MAIGRVPGETGIQPTIVDAKGDIIAATAADSVTRLAVGSNNQVLTADSATATGLKWAAPDPLTTKGDLFTFSTTEARLPVGTNGHVLTADSSETTGLKWQAPASGGGYTLLSTNSISSGSPVTISSISGSYKHLFFLGKMFRTNNNNDTISIRFNGDTGNNYYWTRWYQASTTFTVATGSAQSSITDVIRTNNDTGVSEGAQFAMWLYRYTDTDNVSGQIYGRGANVDGANGRASVSAYFTYDGTAAVDSITFVAGSNIVGTLYIYGVN